MSVLKTTIKVDVSPAAEAFQKELADLAPIYDELGRLCKEILKKQEELDERITSALSRLEPFRIEDTQR